MFSAEGTIHNIGQFYNFANLLGFRSVQCIQNPKNVLGCVTAQMPNHNYVRYSVSKDLSITQLLKDENFYNSNTAPYNGVEFLKHHFNLEDDNIVVYEVVCGISGAGVLFSTTDYPQYYLLEVITTAHRPKGL